MNCKISLCLLLSLVSVVISQQVPEGCVEIRNFQIDKFLVKSRRDNNQRRHVTYDTTAQQWIIVKEGDHYKISHAETKEPLFEASGNYVFTWLSRTDQGKADDWVITPSGKLGCF
uniref:16.7 kDa salivary protein n=1 Tax=Culex tarsalis TaxID=7177 RepID=B8RIR7_CULTA